MGIRNGPGPSGLGMGAGWGGRSQDEIVVGIDVPEQKEEMTVKESQRFLRSAISKNTTARNQQMQQQQQQQRVVPDYEVDYGQPVQQRGHGRQGSIGSGNHF